MNPATAAKIVAVNRAHKAANDLYPQLAAAFAPFVGQKVVKADGELTAKAAKAVPELPNSGGLSVYRWRSDYRLAYVVKSCASVEGASHCTYHEATVQVGRLDNGVLTAITDHEPLSDDYTREEVTWKMAALEAAELEYRNARSALHPFEA